MRLLSKFSKGSIRKRKARILEECFDENELKQNTLFPPWKLNQYTSSLGEQSPLKQLSWC